MFRFTRARKRAVAATVLAVLLAVSIVSPALGGPSIGKVAKTAKSALSTAKTANSRARSASNKATAATNLAAAANGKADQALARPVVTAGGITTVSAVVAIPASGFTTTFAACPAGQRAISGGVNTTVANGGTWLDRASDNRTAWFGGGEDLAGGGGTLTVYAYCVPAGQATIAKAGHGVSPARQLHALEAARRGAGE